MRRPATQPGEMLRITTPAMRWSAPLRGPPLPVLVAMVIATLLVPARAVGVAQAAALAAGEQNQLHHHRHRHHLAHRQRSGELAGQPVGMFPTALPTLGLVNITPPTVVPPEVRLDPWKDAQPLDTALGSLLAGSLAEEPTVTPPPLQSSLDLVQAACPLLTGWPLELEITTFDPCDNAHEGGWADAATREPLVDFRQGCSPFGPGLTPQLVYSTAQGELMATSRLKTTIVGSKVAIADCAGVPRWTLEEKVYHEVGRVDQSSCDRYGSCDGTIWIQYFLYRIDGRLAAQTPYLKLFEDTIQINDPSGQRLAMAKRVGDWAPNSAACLGPRRWLLTFATPAPPGDFAVPTAQWPLAALVSIASVRDTSRRPSGLLAPTWCEISKVACSALFALLVAGSLLAGAALFFGEALEPLRALLYELEQRLCPRRMKLPSKYDGG